MPRLTHLALAAVALALASALPSMAQRAAPVSHLDLHQLTGSWYQIARLPDKPEKKCLTDGRILYALSDKPRSFQQGLFCKTRAGDAQNSNTSGQQDKSGAGELKVPRLLLLHTKYWVLAADPGYTWALIGTPNHKTLWLLARTPTLDPATRAHLEAIATAAGFKTEKLLTVPHTVTTFRAEQTTPGTPAQVPAEPAATKAAQP